MRSSTEKICGFSKVRKCARKIFIVFVTLSNFNRSFLYKWGMAPAAACECGAGEQTVDHVVLQCLIHRPPHGLHGLTGWKMRQPNGCSTPAPESSAAKHWMELPHKKKKQLE